MENQTGNNMETISGSQRLGMMLEAADGAQRLHKLLEYVERMQLTKDRTTVIRMAA